LAGAKASYEGGMAVEDRPPPPVIPPWVTAYQAVRPLFAMPTLRYALNVFGLIGGLAIACWVSPNLASTALLLNVVSAMGFMRVGGRS
jgi:hypothetical protein